MTRARCEQHGIFYNPEGPGCPVCLATPAMQKKDKGWASASWGTRIAAIVVAVWLFTSVVRTLGPVPGRVRAELARDSSATQHQTSAVEPIVEAAGPSPSDQAEHRMLADLHVQLTSAVASARSRVLSLPEPAADRRSTEFANQQRQWESVRQSVLASLESTWRRVPSNHTWSTSAGLAISSMEQAVDGLESVLERSNLPSRGRRESAFDRCADRMATAKERLDRLVG